MWPFGKQRVQRQFIRKVRARYDAAQTTPENRNHWLQADALSAAAAGNPTIRRTLRNRGRYEVANNSYARGIVLTLANYVVGTGPRLQMGATPPNANSVIETMFAKWSTAINLAAKLRTMRMAKAQDGEAFAQLFTNQNLNSDIKLDLRLIEADQVSTPGLVVTKANAVDGIVFDAYGNPAEYHVLKTHPGANMPGSLAEYTSIPAANMLHWFRQDRPDQYRGLPDIMPALPLFAQLRRYSLAVISAAEIAANQSVFFETTLPPDGTAPDGPGDDGAWGGEEMDVPRNMGTFLPEGWKPYQMKAEQPSTTHDSFVAGKLNEIARCLSMPLNIAAGNSKGLNYASGRLDHQAFAKSIRVEQDECEISVLERVFAAWMEEADLVLSNEEKAGSLHQWMWPGFEHVDPAKEATAQATRLTSYTTTLSTEYAKEGKDWETELRQRAKELELMDTLGLTPAEPVAEDEQDEEPEAATESGEPDDEETERDAA